MIGRQTEHRVTLTSRLTQDIADPARAGTFS